MKKIKNKKCKMNSCPQEAYKYTSKYNTKEVIQV